MLWDMGPAMLSWYVALFVFSLLWITDVVRLRRRTLSGGLRGVFSDWLLRRRLFFAAACVVVGGIAQLIVDVTEGRLPGFGMSLLTILALVHIVQERKDAREQASILSRARRVQEKEVT